MEVRRLRSALELPLPLLPLSLLEALPLEKLRTVTERHLATCWKSEQQTQAQVVGEFLAD